jgi:hypothetical protein
MSDIDHDISTAWLVAAQLDWVQDEIQNNLRRMQVEHERLVQERLKALYRLVQERLAAVTAERDAAIAERDQIANAVKMQSRACELLASAMRNNKRTGGWEGADGVASAFDRVSAKLRAAIGTAA